MGIPCKIKGISGAILPKSRFKPCEVVGVDEEATSVVVFKENHFVANFSIHHCPSFFEELC